MIFYHINGLFKHRVKCEILVLYTLSYNNNDFKGMVIIIYSHALTSFSLFKLIKYNTNDINTITYLYDLLYFSKLKILFQFLHRIYIKNIHTNLINDINR